MTLASSEVCQSNADIDAAILARFGTRKICAAAFGVTYSCIMNWESTGRVPALAIRKAPPDVIAFLNSDYSYQRISGKKGSPAFVGPQTPRYFRPPSGYVDHRLEAMETRWRSGQTLQQIGDFFKITRERVRQILRKNGIPVEDGGLRRKSEQLATIRNASRDAECLVKHGCTYDEYQVLRHQASRPYAYQKRSARYRGIKWDITIAAWWRIWQGSGKWAQRGRGKGYCMARLDDTGPYAIGNVHIITGIDNAKEWRRTGHRSASGTKGGVYYALPGYSKPWQVKHGKKSIGYFATEAEARAAKHDYVSSHPKKFSANRHV